MKYFAKYLPVEGEPQGCDCMICDAEMPLEQNCRRIRRMKLFLCSRDIQVGEEFKFKNFPEKLTRVTANEDIRFWIAANVSTGKRLFIIEQCYKIIGPISPEAAWVKEGDEFEEGQIEAGWTTSINNYTEPFIKIKGSCSHFH